MRIAALAAAGFAALIGLAAAKAEIPAALRWAYPTAPAGTEEPKLGDGPFKAPNGKLLTGPEIDKMDVRAMDWFPSMHPPAPTVVLGPQRKGGPEPCAACHGPSGVGLANVPDIAGLPEDYIVQQLHAFRSGERRSAEPGRLATQMMIAVAKAADEDEIRAAAHYFAAVPRRPRIKVIESATAPSTKIERFGWLYRSGNGAQTLNGGVVETTEDLARLYMYDPSLKQMVYVPKGALARGAALVRSGGEGAQPCAMCHGAGLKGLGVAPPLAGRDPSYLARMLWDIKTGARRGPSVALMQGPAHGLTPTEMSDIAVYLASLKP